MKESFGLTIGQVASQSGVAASAIRYYESLGVLPKPSRIGGQRCYDEEVLRRLQVIDVAQRAGFSLEEIRDLLTGSEEAEAAERLQALARRKLPEVEALIARAEAMKSWLQVAQECHCSTLELCALFEEAGHRVLSRQEADDAVVTT